jgi:rRNA maturation protein Nop10
MGKRFVVALYYDTVDVEEKWKKKRRKEKKELENEKSNR